MSDIIDSSVAGTVIGAKDVVELNTQVINLFKETPFMSVPAGFSGNISKTANDVYSKVEDRLNVGIEKYVPNLDDLEVAVVSLIGCVPAVGPMMQGLFTLMSSKTKGSQRQEVITKETIKNMVDIEMANVKKELIQTIKEKVEKSNIDQKVKLCEKALDGIKEANMNSLLDSLTHLKLRLLKKQIPEKNDALLIGIRSKFDSLRINIKMLLTLVTDKAILLYCPNVAMEAMFLYILVLNDLVYHWYQYGFDPEYALGTPADEEEPATHSYREKLHINIQKFLKEINNTSYYYNYYASEVDRLFKNEYDFDEQQEITARKKKEEYVLSLKFQDINNVDKVFESDPYYYPIPLIKVTDGFNKVDRFSLKSVKIETSQKKCPCIYRIDGKEFEINGDQLKFRCVEKDLATGCIGKYLNSQPVSLNFELDQAKCVSIRCLFLYENLENYKPKAIYSILKGKNEIIQEEYRNFEQVYGTVTLDDMDAFYCLAEEDQNKLRLGFVTSKKYIYKDSFGISIILDASETQKMLFCELIVSDQ